MALLAALDEQELNVFIPRCSLIEIAAVSTRLADPHASKEISDEIETIFTLIPEEQVIKRAKKLPCRKGAPVLIRIFLLWLNRIRYLSLLMTLGCTVSVNGERSSPG